MSKISISNFTISNFFFASAASFAVVTRKLFSIRYSFTNSLILSSSSTASIWNIFYSLIILFKTFLNLITESESEFLRAL